MPCAHQSDGCRSPIRTRVPLCRTAHITGALAKDGDLLFPQQASLFYAGKIADELGAFIQMTYSGVGDSFGWDNTDIRYAHHLSFGGTNGNNHSMILGVTLNNNPTVQDVWNTTPAWGFPYSSSAVAPTEIPRRKSTAAPGALARTSAASACTCGWTITITPRSPLTPRQFVEALTLSTAPIAQ